MIKVELLGGLGNQLFEYAAAKSLALDKKTQLKIDLTWIDYINKEKDIDAYGLKYFNIKDAVVRREKPLEISRDIIFRIKKLVNRFLPFKVKWLYREPRFSYDLNFRSLDNVLIYGSYLQSYKYFLNNNDEIIKLLEFKDFVKEANKQYANKIESLEGAVSIHIRRGDYVKNPVVRKLFATFGLEYYYAAIEQIQAKVQNPTFIIFSDDINWVKENLFLENVIYIDFHNEVDRGVGHLDKGHNDLYLMSLCKHNIIANSSFSWWGAWLNKNPDKIVIAPKKWFNNPSLDTRDLLPDEWIKI